MATDVVVVDQVLGYLNDIEKTSGCRASSG